MNFSSTKKHPQGVFFTRLMTRNQQLLMVWAFFSLYPGIAAQPVQAHQSIDAWKTV
jgi:hypothetical protein